MYIKLEISTPILPINKESIGSIIIVAKKTTVNKLYFDFFILKKFTSNLFCQIYE